MNLKDIKIGMKVVPHSKLEESVTNSIVWCSCITKEQPYMYVIKLCGDLPTSVAVCGEDNASVMGDYFYASDLTPYEEQYTCNIPGVTVELVPGKEYWVSNYSEDNAIENRIVRKYICTLKGRLVFETESGEDFCWWNYAVDPETYKESETEMTIEEVAEALRKSGAIKGKLKIKE